MLSRPRTDRAAWADAAYDVAWRILHDREAAIDAAVHGVQVEAIADPASAMLVHTRRRALELLGRAEGGRPAIDEAGGVAFVHDPHSTGDDVGDADQAWGAAEAMGPEEASLVDLHLRFGVPAGVLADELGTAPEQASVALERMRGRLEGALTTWRLWNDGRPRCDDLADEIDAAGPLAFGPVTGRVIAKHAVGCELCRSTMADSQRGGLDTFARAPVLRAPPAVCAAVPADPAGGLAPEMPAPAPGPSVFVDAERAGDLGVDTLIEDASPVKATPPTGPDRVEDLDAGPEAGGPGLLAGILLGVVISVVLVAGITAWVLTNS